MDRRLRLAATMLIACLLVVPPVLANEPDGGTEEVHHEKPGHHDPNDDPCRPAADRLDDRSQRLAQKYDDAHRDLDAEADRFHAGNHSEEERQAFEKEQAAKRDRLYKEEQAERDEAHAVFERECEAAMKEAGYHEEPAYGEPARPQGMRHGPGPDPHPGPDEPPEWITEECRALMAEFDAMQRERLDTYHDEMQATWDRFEEHIRERWDAFWAEGNHTEEEVDAFERDMEAERDAFRDKMQAEEEARRHEEEAMFERHREKLESTCQPEMPRHAPMAGHAAEVPAEIEALHRACEAKIERIETAFRAEIDALESAWRDSETDDDAAFHEKIREKEAAFEAELRSVMRACEEEARALWEEKMAVDAHEAPRDRMGSWSVSESDGKVLLTGKYVSLVGDPATNTLGRIAVAGETFITHLDTLGRLEFFDMAEATDGDSTLVATGEAIRMRIHDNPGGVINLKADAEHAFLLKLPPSLEVQATGSGWELRGASGSAFVRVAPGASEWSSGDRTLKVWGESTFMVKDQANKVLPAVANKHRADLVDAVQDRRLGAEVTVAKTDDGQAVDEAVVYDGDVEVDVETAKDDDEAPVTITVSSHTLEEGRTFVVNVDEAVLDGRIKVAYFDVDEETGAETPAEIQKASSLADVLDATNDDTAEYWVVEDEDGLQVLVSVPHWSVHRFRLESDPDAGMELALPGPAALLLGVAVVAAAGGLARRRD